MLNWSRFAVPHTLTAAPPTGSRSDSGTLFRAARWITASGRAAAKSSRRPAPGAAMSASSQCGAGGEGESATEGTPPRPPGAFAAERRSTGVTAWPSAIRRALSAEPMNPAPPVTRIFMRLRRRRAPFAGFRARPRPHSSRLFAIAADPILASRALRAGRGACRDRVYEGRGPLPPPI